MQRRAYLLLVPSIAVGFAGCNGSGGERASIGPDNSTVPAGYGSPPARVERSRGDRVETGFPTEVGESTRSTPDSVESDQAATSTEPAPSVVERTKSLDETELSYGLGYGNEPYGSPS